MYQYQSADVSDMLNKTIVSIEGMYGGCEQITFTCSDGTRYGMWHEQDCCESVRIEDVAGNPDDLLDTPLLMSESYTNSDRITGTWTFYKFATVKGYVTLRWLGESNGYYSEDVSFYRLDSQP